jgi:hypothetical protein
MTEPLAGITITLHTEEGPMAPVLISCPTTGRLVPTGVEADGEDELDADGHVLLACPDCGGNHQWGLTDAALAVAGT